MARRGEGSAGLPSFFQGNPWLDILAQRGMEPTPDFMASEAPSAPAVGEAAPVIEPEPVANSSTTTPLVAGFPRELVVRLKVPSELVEAIRELKEAVIMALSVSQRQATIVPIYIPISVAQMAQAPQVSASPSRPVPPRQASCFQHFPPLAGPGREAGPGATGEVICPKCGRPGKLYEYRRGPRSYIYVLHGHSKCSLGPADKVKVKWPSLAERALLHNAPRHQARILSPRDPRPSPRAWSIAPKLKWSCSAGRADGPVAQPGGSGGLLSPRSRVQIPPGPPQVRAPLG